MIYYILVAISILFLLLIVRLVLNNKLMLKYSILWIIYSIGLFAMSINVNIINVIAEKIGIFYAPSMIFLFGLMFFMIIILYLSIVVTKQNKNILKLTQECGILKNEIEEIKKDVLNR